MTIPSKVRDDVLIALVKQFDEVKWEELTPSATSEWYDRFLRDEHIGRRLSPYMGDAKIRSWIKDGPAKEYRRALEGRGSYAHYTSRRYPGPDVIVRSALGDRWKLIADSVQEKPMRCCAESEGQAKFLVWGPIESRKDLVWHAAVKVAEDPHTGLVLVITRPSAAPLAGPDWELVEKLAKVLDVDCKQVTYAVAKKPPTVDLAYPGVSVEVR